MYCAIGDPVARNIWLKILRPHVAQNKIKPLRVENLNIVSSLSLSQNDGKNETHNANVYIKYSHCTRNSEVWPALSFVYLSILWDQSLLFCFLKAVYNVIITQCLFF